MLIVSQTRVIQAPRVETSIPTILKAIHQLRSRCSSEQAREVLDGISSETSRVAVCIATHPFSHVSTRQTLFQSIALYGREVATQLIVQSGQLTQLLDPVLQILWEQHRQVSSALLLSSGYFQAVSSTDMDSPQEYEAYLEHLLDATCQSLQTWPVWHAFMQWLKDQEDAVHETSQNVIYKWAAEGTKPEGIVAELKQQLEGARATCT